MYSIATKLDRVTARARRAEHRKLAADLAHYRTQADVFDLYAALDRYSVEETAEIRGILDRAYLAAA